MALNVSHLKKVFSGVPSPREILRDACLEMEPGETGAVLGPSGVGKSTLLHLIGGLDVPSGGAIFLGEINVTELSGSQLAAYRCKEVGFVFQDHHLLPQLTAMENVLLPSLSRSAPHQDPDRALKLLDEVGLEERWNAFPFRLSGGERQRLALARALLHEPQLLLCDEPTGNLDPETGEKVGRLLVSLASEKGTMVLTVTHNQELADQFEKKWVLREGRLWPV